MRGTTQAPSGLSIKNEGDRPIIHQFYLHICPKLAMGNTHVMLTDPVMLP